MRTGLVLGAVALYASGGALAAVCVAWCLARYGPVLPPGRGATVAPPARWPVPVPASWPALPPIGTGDGTIGGPRSSAIEARRPGRHALELTLHRIDPGFVMRRWTLMRVRTGWPLPAMQQAGWEAHQEPVGAFSRGTLLEPAGGVWGGLEGLSPLDGRDLRGFPLIPVWPGLLADSVVYGVALFAARAGVVAAVRRRRRRAGLCGDCRYDLRGLAAGVCPECGRASA